MRIRYLAWCLTRCLAPCPKRVNSYYFASTSTIKFNYFSSIAINMEFSFWVYSTFNKQYFRDVHMPLKHFPCHSCIFSGQFLYCIQLQIAKQGGCINNKVSQSPQLLSEVSEQLYRLARVKKVMKPHQYSKWKLK